MRMKTILVVADPLETFKTYKDTTFAMMRELQKRGHTIAATEPQHMAWRSGQPATAAVRHIRLTGDADPWFEVTQTATAVEAGAAASGEHRAGTALHAAQPGHAGAVEHTGVGQLGHDRQQRIEAGVLLPCPGGSAARQLRQRLLDDCGEAQLRFLAGTMHAVEPANLRTMAVAAGRYGAVAQQGQARCTHRYLSRRKG